jgi:cyclic pyranopterin phosphate synthase
MSLLPQNQEVFLSGAQPPARFADQFGRMLRDLRISVTDRCNFRCAYCMPRDVFGADHQFMPKNELLDYEEITRLARIFASAGVRKLRLTGGEPLLRADLQKLVGMLAVIPGIEDLALTTNGVLLARHAAALRFAGLSRVTVSLDAIDPALFCEMSSSSVDVRAVFEGIEEARRCGFSPVKINMVVRRGVNESEILPMARRFSGQGYVLRFIEYMDVGTTNGWKRSEVVSLQEILEVLKAEFGLDEMRPSQSGETARRYKLIKTGGEVGVIASVTEPFCKGCTRARLTASGQLHTCLFGPGVLDLKALLRDGASDGEILQRLGDVWRDRNDQYSELRSAAKTDTRRAEMSVLGG